MALPSIPIARPLLKAPLAVGDIAPEVVLRAVDGSTVELNGDTMAGNTIVVLFCPRFTGAVAEAIAALRTSVAAFAAAGAKLVAITLEPTKVAAEQALPCPLLLDRSGDVFRAYNADQREAPTMVVLRSNQHVAVIVKDAPAAQPGAALGAVERLAAERQSGLMAPHPPVLIVPDVLSRDDCRRLIRIY
jgi:peroxiredoxin